MNEIVNYCELVANGLRARMSENIEIYSNVDPSREWTGRTTIEIASTDNEPTQTISGAVIYETTLTVCIRAVTKTYADLLAISLSDRLADVMKEMKEQSLIDSYTYTRRGSIPDARGLALGESFYSFLDFNLIKKDGLCL